MPDLYAVIGNPIAHSKAPLINNEFAKQTEQDIVYERILAPLDGFEEEIKKFQARGGKGLNITIPFKEQAWSLCNERSVRAGLCGAANTMVFKENGVIYGDITDGVGLVRDLLQNLYWQIQNKRVLLLGAGAAIRGVITSLLTEYPAEITIVNRTRSKAEKLDEDFSNLGNIQTCEYGDLSDKTFDVIINGTSASLEGEVPPLPDDMVLTQTCCYDMFYNDHLTPFLSWAKKRNAKKFADGIGMLIEQAAESFYLWRGVRPNTKPVLQQWRT